MHAILVSDPKIPKAIRAHHEKRLRRWTKEGAKGRKPKLYQAAEEILSMGLDHIDDSPSSLYATSKGSR